LKEELDKGGGVGRANPCEKQVSRTEGNRAGEKEKTKRYQRINLSHRWEEGIRIKKGLQGRGKSESDQKKVYGKGAGPNDGGVEVNKTRRMKNAASWI